MTLSESEKRDISPAKLALSTNSQLPEGWIQKPLKEVAEIAFSGVNKKSRSDQKTVRLCNYMDVYNNDYITADIDFMTATASDREIERFTLQQGDVIITKDSETPDDIGVPAVVVDDLDNVICGYHLALLRPKQNEIDGIFFAKELARDRVSNQFSRVANGATRFGLTLDAVRNVKVNVPPLPEQKKIARILGTWDQAIDLTERLIEAKEKRFKWLLKTLISDQQDNPEWRKMKLGEICTFEYGKPLKEQDRIGDEYPVFGSNGIVGSHKEYLVAGPFIVVGRKGSAGTVSYSMSNGFPIDTTFYINLQSGEIHLRFLYYLLLLVELDKISAQSGVPGLNRNDAYKISISIPSSVEQSEITRTLDVARREIDLLNQLAEQYRTQKRGLMQQVLTGKVWVKI